MALIKTAVVAKAKVKDTKVEQQTAKGEEIEGIEAENCAGIESSKGVKGTVAAEGDSNGVRDIDRKSVV